MKLFKNDHEKKQTLLDKGETSTTAQKSDI